MHKVIVTGVLLSWIVCAAAISPGERLTYVAGCIGCHHESPKEHINAPSLMIVRNYSLPEFIRLLRTGVTHTGRNLRDAGSLMGIVATEQFSYMTADEIASVYDFLRNDWSAERAAIEEAKIPLLYKPEPLK